MRLYDTKEKNNEIYRYSDKLLQDGIYKIMYSDGGIAYGKRIFAKKHKDGELYRLYKYPNGDIEYQEKKLAIGSKGWENLTVYKFKPNKLGWEKK